MNRHNPTPFILALAAAILLVGCAVDLDVRRGGEIIRLQLKPATRPADTAIVRVDVE